MSGENWASKLGGRVAKAGAPNAPNLVYECLWYLFVKSSCVLLCLFFSSTGCSQQVRFWTGSLDFWINFCDSFVQTQHLQRLCQAYQIPQFCGCFSLVTCKNRTILDLELSILENPDFGFARLASDSAAEVEKCQGSWISIDFNSCDTFNTVLGQGQEEIRALRCRNREFPKRNSVSAFSTWVIGDWHRSSQQEMQKELEVRYSEPGPSCFRSTCGLLLVDQDFLRGRIELYRIIIRIGFVNWGMMKAVLSRNLVEPIWLRFWHCFLVFFWELFQHCTDSDATQKWRLFRDCLKLSFAASLIFGVTTWCLNQLESFANESDGKPRNHHVDGFGTAESHQGIRCTRMRLQGHRPTISEWILHYENLKSTSKPGVLSHSKFGHPRAMCRAPGKHVASFHRIGWGMSRMCWLSYSEALCFPHIFKPESV